MSNEKEMNFIEVNGKVTSKSNPVTDDRFWNKFMEFLLANDWAFEGKIKEVDNE